MRAVVQRVFDCAVIVDEDTVGRISEGLLVYLGVGRSDTVDDIEYLGDKVVHLRIFPDSDGKMNQSVLDTHGEVMVVSQFTLYGDARKGRRPSYNQAAEPDQANEFYQQFMVKCRSFGLSVQSGVFAAHMRVRYTNNGPITILLDSGKHF